MIQTTQSRKLIQSSGHILQIYRTAKIAHQLKTIPLQNFFAAVAPCSGPIALLYRKLQQKQIKLPQGYASSILFFSCRGELMRSISFDLKERIIFFGFTHDQYLLIVYANGHYFVADPATGSIRQGDFLVPEEKNFRCVGAQLLGNYLVILRDKSMSVVEGLTGTLKVYPVMKLHSSRPIFTANINGQEQLEIVYLNKEAGIQKFNLKQFKDTASGIKLLYQSPFLKSNCQSLVNIAYRQNQLVLFFSDQSHLIDLKTNFVTKISHGAFKIQLSDALSRTKFKNYYKNFYKAGWVGPFPYIYDRKKLIFFTGKTAQFRQLSYNNILSTGKDSLRLIDQHVYIYRCIDSPIYHFSSGSTIAAQYLLKTSDSQALQLYQLFAKCSQLHECATTKQPFSIDLAHSIKDDLHKIWAQLIQITCLFLDPGEQLRCLRLANFLQTYFGIAQDQKTRVNRITHQLRTVNALRHEWMNRWITHGQFVGLKQEGNDMFLKLFLRYNMHFVADMVFQDTHSKAVIFAHWARCKIQKETQSIALDEIRSRYLLMKNYIGNASIFPQLAKYCLRHRHKNLAQLARRLIQFQPDQARKCIVVLIIFASRKDAQSVPDLLDCAQNSKKPQIIHQVLSTLRRISSSSEWLAKTWILQLQRHPLLQQHYIRLLKLQGQKDQLQQHYKHTQNLAQFAHIGISKYMNYNPRATMDQVKALIQKDYIKALPSLGQSLNKCKPNNSMRILHTLKNKSTPILEQQFRQFKQDSQLQSLAQLLIQKDNNWTLAVDVLRRIKSDRVYLALMRKNKIQHAIQQAFVRKNKVKLEELTQRAEGAVAQRGLQMLRQLAGNR